MIETEQVLTLMWEVIERIEDEIKCHVGITFSFLPEKAGLVMTLRTHPTNRQEKQFGYDCTISKIDLHNMRLLEEQWIDIQVNRFIGAYKAVSQ